MGDSKDSSQKKKWATKIKERVKQGAKKAGKVLKKGAKKLLPVAAGWAAGIVFPPAGNILYNFIKKKMDDTMVDLPIIDDVLKRICKDSIGKKSPKYLQEKLKEILQNKTNLKPEQLEMTLETMLRPVNNSLNEAISYIKEYPEQLETLMEEWKEENKELIDELHLDMDTGFDEVKSTILSQNKKVLDGQDKILRKLSQMERQFNRRFSSGVKKIFASKSVSELDLRLISNAQLSMTDYSSRFDISFDPELFISRKEADEAFTAFLNDFLDPFSTGRNLFLVLAGAGMGKTWTLASWARRISRQTADFPEPEIFVPFFISLKLGFEMQFTSFFGASNKTTALYDNLKGAMDTSGLTPILFIDGLDEIKPSEAKSTLAFISNIIRENIPVILSCRDTDWSWEDKIQVMHSHLEDSCFTHSAGGGYTIEGITCKPSLYLEKFTEQEFREVIQRYGIPLEAFSSPDLKEMAKRPINLRLFSEFYDDFGALPDPSNPEEFEVLFLGNTGDPPKTHILGRLGIIGTKRDYLIQIIERFIKKGPKLKANELGDLIHNTKNFKVLRSSGLLREMRDRLSTYFTLDELYYPHLKHIATLAGITGYKADSQPEPGKTAESIPTTSKEGGSKAEKKCRFSLELGNRAMDAQNYEEAINEFQQAKKICKEELFDTELLTQIENSLSKVKELQRQEKERAEKRKKGDELLGQARNKYDAGQWEVAIRLGQEAGQIFADLGDSDARSKCQTIVDDATSQRRKEEEKERERERERLREKNRQLVETGKKHLDDRQWDAALDAFTESKSICSSQEWTEGAQYADEMMAEIEQMRDKFEVVSFRGAKLIKYEVDVLKELESLTGKEFSEFKEIKYDTKMGFVAENNRVSGLGLYECDISTLPESITKLTSLEKLSLSSNKIKTLPESITKLTSLKKLDLGDNSISTLPELIGNLTSLEKLYVDNNDLKTLPESITKLTSLKELDLGYNSISTLPESIGNLKSLEKLNLRFNSITTLPESIGNLKSLEILWLRDNDLKNLPESITKLTSLSYLDIGGNSITTLPESIGNLRSLEELWLENNSITTLPESITKLTSLKVLYLYGNKIKTLPESLKKLEKQGLIIYK